MIYISVAISTLVMDKIGEKSLRSPKGFQKSKIYILAFQSPAGPEMLALRLAFRAILFQTDGWTDAHTALCI